MDKNIKILTVCSKGNCRSVGTRYCLYKRGYGNVIATGCTVAPDQLFEMLCDWADIILVAKPKHANRVSSLNKKKVNNDFTIGEDAWNNPMNKELHEIANKQLDKIGLK